MDRSSLKPYHGSATTGLKTMRRKLRIIIFTALKKNISHSIFSLIPSFILLTGSDAAVYTYQDRFYRNRGAKNKKWRDVGRNGSNNQYDIGLKVLQLILLHKNIFFFLTRQPTADRGHVLGGLELKYCI